jgi:hypothetical protein
VHSFRICLPADVKRAVADYPKDSTLFTGFAVPAKTNLESKRLTIVPGDYDLLKGAKAFGHFTAGGVTFDRAKFEEGSGQRFDAAHHLHLEGEKYSFRFRTSLRECEQL